MKVFIVYCHPSKNSFTYEVKEAFIKGLESAGHSYEISDLYADGFNPVMSEKALFLITMGGSLKDKVRRNQLSEDISA